MTLEEIKKAVDEGKKVFWVCEIYPVTKDDLGQYFITCKLNGSAIGLYSHYGLLNGMTTDFYIKGEAC
jgi:hypothetical protein